MPRERALACAVRLLDRGFFRIGGEEYAESNDSYGVATVLREHVSLNGKEVVFDFPAKSGQRRIQSVRDPAVRAAIEVMRRRRSGPPDLLVFKQDGGWRDVRSTDVNDYIQANAGEEFSAKVLSHLHGTVLAAVELAQFEQQVGKGSKETAIREAVHHVAERLGNAPAVCRSSYIDRECSIAFVTGRRSRRRPAGARFQIGAAARSSAKSST